MAAGSQRLQLVLAIDALGAVLHDEDAQRAPGAQNRHAKEGIVDLLARFRQVGEGRVLLRVRQVERAGAGRDGADEALPQTQLRVVHRAGVEALGGVEFQHGVGAQDVERADLRHHVGGDLTHDAVEPRLRLERLRHQFAEPFQQYARAAAQVTHSGSPRPEAGRHAATGESHEISSG